MDPNQEYFQPYYDGMGYGIPPPVAANNQVIGVGTMLEPPLTTDQIDLIPPSVITRGDDYSLGFLEGMAYATNQMPYATLPTWNTSAAYPALMQNSALCKRKEAEEETSKAAAEDDSNPEVATAPTLVKQVRKRKTSIGDQAGTKPKKRGKKAAPATPARKPAKTKAPASKKATKASQADAVDLASSESEDEDTPLASLKKAKNTKKNTRC
mmetsp:Transcript_97285/g.145789  ORF Transcript_97285/g.145789 Transcript_97285/m.145789 type:complete len:211 (+) Transcript_97285:259-891(+)